MGYNSEKVAFERVHLDHLGIWAKSSRFRHRICLIRIFCPETRHVYFARVHVQRFKTRAFGFAFDHQTEARKQCSIIEQCRFTWFLQSKRNIAAEMA